MKSISFLVVFLISLVIQAQNGYNIPESFISFDKDITFGTVHGYLEIESDTSDTLPMVWIARKEIDFPNEWIINFDDQSNYFPVVNTNDRDSFNLMPEGGFVRKLIIGMAHNGAADTSSIFFTVYPENNINDSSIIEYQFRIAREKPEEIDTTYTTTGVQAHLKQPFEINMINRGQRMITTNSIVDEIRVYDLLGNLIGSAKHSRTIALSEEMHESIIIVSVKDNGKIHTQKFCLAK
ncbi:hypothetical protein N8911_01045 [bacterium]|nr:hypothetical protein [bacterium]